MELPKAGRIYAYWPFTGLNGATPSLLVGEGVPMSHPLTAAPEYEADPVVQGAEWYRALIAGPLAEDNPAGTVVFTQSAPVNFQISSNPEVIITRGEWVILTP